MQKKKAKLPAAAVLLTGALFWCACGSDRSYPAADLVVLNAKIATMDRQNPRAEAMAIVAERIAAVGPNRLVEDFIEPGRTMVIDGRGRLVVPGFNDAHIHFRGTVGLSACGRARCRSRMRLRTGE